MRNTKTCNRKRTRSIPITNGIGLKCANISTNPIVDAFCVQEWEICFPIREIPHKDH